MRTEALVLPALVLALLLGVPVDAVRAQAALIFVTPPDLAGPTWTGQVTGGGDLGFVAAPSDGISGGSLEFGADRPIAGAQLRFSDMFWRLPLSQLVSLHYRAFATGDQCKNDKPKKPNQRDPNHTLILVLDVDTDGDFVADDELVFDPAVQADVACETWQDWDAKNGLWYSVEDKRPVRNAAPLGDYVAMHPGARLVYGGIRVLAPPAVVGKAFIGNLSELGLEGPPVCTGGGCVSGPAPTYLFRVSAPGP